MVVEETVYLIIYLASVFKSHLIFQAVQKRRKWNLLPAYWMPSPLTWCRPLTQQHLLEAGGENVSRTRAQCGRKSALFLRPCNYALSHLPALLHFLFLGSCWSLAYSYLITGKSRSVWRLPALSSQRWMHWNDCPE